MDFRNALPRIVVAGLSGGVGKTTLSVGLIRALRSRGIAVQAFKKGPDYIDPAWLSIASGRKARNLDVRLFGDDNVVSTFRNHAISDGISIIEGNRGIFDGGDSRGTHSTASLARLLNSPILLVVDASKATRTVAALVLGCMHFEPSTAIAAVVLNKVVGERHCRVVTQAIEESTGIRVLGALPKAVGPAILSDSPEIRIPKDSEIEQALRNVEQLINNSVDVNSVLSLARSAGHFDPVFCNIARSKRDTSVIRPNGKQIAIGVLMDESFSFYYPENLEALERLGARIVAISPLRDKRIPPIDLLYAGGGFFADYVEELESNHDMLREVRAVVARGVAVYSEGSGVTYLANRVHIGDRVHRMAGVLPIDVSVDQELAGHGYVQGSVIAESPFFCVGDAVVGHQHNYCRVIAGLERVRMVVRIDRGVGVNGGGVDGIVRGDVFGMFVHVHALSPCRWAEAVVRAAVKTRVGSCGKVL